MQALRKPGPTEVSLPELGRISGLEAAGEESAPLPRGKGSGDRGARPLTGPRPAGRPQADQRHEAAVVEDLDPAGQLDDTRELLTR